VKINMKWTPILLLAAALASAAGQPRIFYSKSFPNSVPAYAQITLEANGDGEYKEAPDDELPLKFHLAEAEVRTVFELAEKLDHFKRPLETQLKVAFMGTKTFRWENGDQKGEVKFNFSEDLSAQAILDWFERMAESAQLRIELERSAKYDRLGVDKALRSLWSAMDRKRVVAPEQYLPMLDRIANNESYMHTARMKASEMAETIRKTQ
jgi:hypothetical protein